MTFSLQVLLLLCIIVAFAKIAGSLFVRWGQPGVLGEILVGLILGPTLLNLPAWGVFAQQASHPDGLIVLIKELAAIGVICLMFIAGMETDLKEMKKVGLVALFAAVGGVILPFIAGTSLGIWMGHYNIYESIFIGVILTATSVSISAQTLIELKALKSKEGTTILGAAVIDDVLGIIILSLVIAFKPRGIGATSHGIALPDIISNGIGNQMGMDEPTITILKVVVLVILMIGFFIIAWLVGIKYLEKWTEKVSNWPTAEALTAFAIFVCLFYSWSAEWVGSVAAITGAYLAGLLFAQTKFKHDIEQRFSIITYSFFVPVFFVSIGLDADARSLFAPVVALFNGKGIPGVENLGMGIFWLTIAIVGAAIVTKVVGCYLGALMKGFSNASAIKVGVGMISRGEVGLIVASVGLAAGIITRDIFTIMVLMVLITTLITPILLKIVFSIWKNETSD
jgi:Kef-type K+ transport system membrane component KefB